MNSIVFLLLEVTERTYVGEGKGTIISLIREIGITYKAEIHAYLKNK